ncbi:MAG: hypothetical protein JWN53_1428 [Gemmatimonadetes bacterium]|nr:hypothetical protein [Gemmatimonadota bacterium]
MTSSAASRVHFRWLRHLGRTLAMVAQIVVLLAPSAEAREERGLAPHVEASGTRQHAGHRPERCPACILLAVHGRAAERTEIPAIERAQRVTVPAELQYATPSAEAPANSCRAPPSRV